MALIRQSGLAAFFTFMTVAEGGGKRAVMRKFQDVYLPAMKAMYIIWPAVQIVNFRLMPLQFQLVSVPLIYGYPSRAASVVFILTTVRSHLCRLSVSRGLRTSR